MKLRPSRLLRELRAGLNPCTLKLNLNDPRIIEMAGHAGAIWPQVGVQRGLRPRVRYKLGAQQSPTYISYFQPT